MAKKKPEKREMQQIQSTLIHVFSMQTSIDKVAKAVWHMFVVQARSKRIFYKKKDFI